MSGTTAGATPRGVVITGTGVLSPLGDSLEALAAALAAGRSGLSEITSFDPEDFPCRRGGEIAGFDPRTYLGEGNFRPLDRTGRLTTAAVALALADAGWSGAGGDEDPRGADDPELGLALGTMFGSVRTIAEFDRRGLTAGPRYTKPLDFANSVINAAAGQAAIWHHLTGVNATVAGGTTAGLQALAHAADLVAAGRAGALLAGGADELCFESFLGFARGGFLAGGNGAGGDGSGLAVPFHPASEGFVPAEGAALVLLEAEEAARGRGARILARILGHGTVFDPSRGRDPDRAAAAVARAVRLALEGADLGPEGVACLSASANGLPALDRAEARGVAEALGARAAELPVTAVKGLLGESLGASGAFQVLAALAAFRAGELPGIPGLDRLEDGFPLPLAGPDARPVSGDAALVTAVGLDGNVCALVLSTGDACGAISGL
ncbi:MAG: beta-ketoacyl synthase N-terminal-like domain-containing protein [Acidobacteriota bacterium]|jgi:3-oxoacyl-[acyl-carrier-protein] synthase II